MPAFTAFAAALGDSTVDNRPLLRGDDPRGVLRRLMDERYPIYADAAITVDTDDWPTEDTAKAVESALRAWDPELMETPS